MKNLSFLLGTFLFIFSFCQTPQAGQSSIEKEQKSSAQIYDIECKLQPSEVVGYLDFVRCYPELGYCAHFMIPEDMEQVKNIPLGSESKISGRFSLEGTAIGRKYYYLTESLLVTQ